MTSYTFLMHSSKYILWQDETGWRGYIEGYPEQEAQGNSFEDLQLKLWQLHQDFTKHEQEPEREPNCYQQGEHHRHQGHTPTMQPPTVSRPMSRPQTKRRARVEQLMFGMISNP
jgi:hypothetical protein